MTDYTGMTLFVLVDGDDFVHIRNPRVDRNDVIFTLCGEIPSYGVFNTYENVDPRIVCPRCQEKFEEEIER